MTSSLHLLTRFSKLLLVCLALVTTVPAQAAATARIAERLSPADGGPPKQHSPRAPCVHKESTPDAVQAVFAVARSRPVRPRPELRAPRLALYLFHCSLLR